MLRHRASARHAEDRPHGLGPFLKRWTIPIIGGITPVGLIVVNIAAFIVRHLSEFRWSITAAAFVSSLMLNAWMAINVYRVLQRRRPNHPLVQDGNEGLVVVGGVAVVLAASILAALFCYWGLNDPDNLPNGWTFFSGAIAIALPVLLQAGFARSRRGDTRAADVQITPGPRGTPAATPPPGYTPPRYQPPS